LGSLSTGGSFRLGGREHPDYVERNGEGEYHVRFIVAAWVVFHVDAERVGEVRRTATGIGVPFELHIRLRNGIQISLWPAMPPAEQWTNRHEENR
jgi:hypothetical protein